MVEYLTIKQTAAELGIAPQTLKRRMCEKKLPFPKPIRLGYHIVLFEPAEIARFVEKYGKGHFKRLRKPAQRVRRDL